MAPDGKPGWKRPRNEFFNWHNMTCVSCFSKALATMCWENSTLRMLETGNEEYALAWVFSPATGLSSFLSEDAQSAPM